MKSQNASNRSGIRFLLAATVGLGLFLSGSVQADNGPFSTDGFSQLMDGRLHLAPVGHRGGELRMTLNSPSRETHAAYISAADNGVPRNRGVHLSVKLPW